MRRQAKAERSSGETRGADNSKGKKQRLMVEERKTYTNGATLSSSL